MSKYAGPSVPVVEVTFSDAPCVYGEPISCAPEIGSRRPMDRLRRSLGQFSSSSSLLPHSASSHLASEPTGARGLGVREWGAHLLGRCWYMFLSDAL